MIRAALLAVLLAVSIIGALALLLAHSLRPTPTSFAPDDPMATVPIRAGVPFVVQDAATGVRLGCVATGGGQLLQPLLIAYTPTPLPDAPPLGPPAYLP